MREDVYAAPLSYAIESVTAQAGDVAAIVRGSFQVPDWLRGSPFLHRDAAGRPQVVGTLTLDFILALPRSAQTEGRAPLIMYQHGNPGSAENEVPGSAEAFLAEEGFAVAGFTDVLNRRWPVVEDQNFFIFGADVHRRRADFYLQTYAEQMAFLRVLRRPTP
jgi:poly(3-hydroxybutyrate) depolymerase